MRMSTKRSPWHELYKKAINVSLNYESMELKECARVWGGGEATGSAQEFRVYVPRASSPACTTFQVRILLQQE